MLAVGYTKSKLVTDAMMWFDKFSCKRSDLVITVGRDLVETVENRFRGKKVPKTVMINNWIDENEIYPLDENNERVVAFKKKYGLDGKFVIMYSGNIGLYYDLENLIKVVEKIKVGTKTADGREVVFAFVGAGSVLDKLVLYVKQHHKLILDPVASRYVRLIFELALQGNRTGTIAKILNEKQIPTPAAYHVAESHVYSEQKAWDLQRSHWTSGTVYHVLKNEKYKGTYVGAKFIMPVPCKHRVLRAPLEQQVRIEDSHVAIVTPEEFEQAQMVIMLQHGKHQAGNYTKHQYPLKGKVYCGYCQKLMKYRVLKKLGPSFNCRFSATAVDSPCKRIPISEELLEHIVRNALAAQIKQAEYVLEILHERERKALICFSALERQEEKLSAEKAEIVKQRVALYEQYADGNMSKEEFIRQRDAYRVQEDEKMEQIQRLRAEKNQTFQPVKKDTDNLQAVMNTVGEAGDVMHLSQNVVETFIDRIEVFNDKRVKIHFTFEDVLAGYAE